MIDIVSATRLPQSGFWKDSPLGISLRRLAHDPRLVAQIAYANQRGLPDIYNQHLRAPGCAEMTVFVHDDVWIDDNFLADRVVEGLQKFDVIGVAGNRRRVERQPAWAFVDDKFTWDDKANFSGSVAHGRQPFGRISHYGPVPAACELLDGVFLAARTSALISNGVFFDPRFDFHLYDVDFCRSARQCGLRLGTWPVCLTHRSGGAFGTPQWRESYRAYLDKWQGE